MQGKTGPLFIHRLQLPDPGERRILGSSTAELSINELLIRSY
jgi:hypothetical protein